jgi:hypothetical protein
MVDFFAATLKPDGRMPVIGDADDGRLIIAGCYGLWDRLDGRQLLGAAALALGQPRWLAWAGPSVDAPEWQDIMWGTFWWGRTPDEISAAQMRAPAVPEAVSRLFPDAGIAVNRSCDGDGSYLLVSNGVVGTNGFGNHKHNDLLSFEYFDRGAAVVVDPGSYVYTSDFDARNAFRSTASHNTVMVDGTEQNTFRPEWLFRMFEKARPIHLAFEALDDGTMIYEGAHDGYATQLEEGVRHGRRFVHDRVSGRLAIEDRLQGTGAHDAVWHFHFAPGVEAVIGEDGRALRLIADGLAWRLAWDDPALAAELMGGWVSPSYGVRWPSLTLNLARHVALAQPLSVGFELVRLEG